MWWIIGVVGALLGVVLIWRNMMLASHNALVLAAQNQIRASMIYFSNSQPYSLEPWIWNDKYLLGYMKVSTALLVDHIGGKSLDVTQRGSVFVNAVRGLNPLGYEKVCLRAHELVVSDDPEYCQGGEDATKVFGLMLNKLRPEIMSDPDIQAALVEGTKAQSFAEEGTGAKDDRAGANTGASAVLLATYMKRHEARLGDQVSS